MSDATLPTRVLVVDDNADAAISLGMLLAAAGYRVRVAQDGPSALDEAAHFAPEACILDINMPGMDGYTLARQLRERAGDRPPVLATVTAYDGFTHLDRAVEAGFDLHFTKPADPGELADQLRHAVATR